jgi:hypothetical protein
MPTIQKNFRFDEHYVGLLGYLSERFRASETEIVRRALDFINYRLGMAIRMAERFIEQLTERYGADARIELRLPDEGSVHADVYVDRQLDEELIGQVAVGPFEERARGIERYRIYLAPKVESRYSPGPHVFEIHPELYIGVIDPTSRAGLSIRIGDLTPEMQEFWGFVGRPQDESDEEAFARAQFLDAVRQAQRREGSK